MDRNTNIVFVLAILVAFALGLSVNAPDIETPFTDPEKPHLVIVQVPARVDPPAEDRTAKAVREMTRRESTRKPSWRYKVIPEKSMKEWDGNMLKTIECLDTGRGVERCDCWIDGQCDKRMSEQRRFRDCYEKTKQRTKRTDRVAQRNCECWVYDEGPAGTLCHMIYKRDTCQEQFATPELADDCYTYWQHKMIPKRMGWEG